MMQTLMTNIREFITRGVTYGSPMVALSSQGEKKARGVGQGAHHNGSGGTTVAKLWRGRARV
jgi:hypothetical protein